MGVGAGRSDGPEELTLEVAQGVTRHGGGRERHVAVDEIHEAEDLATIVRVVVIGDVVVQAVPQGRGVIPGQTSGCGLRHGGLGPSPSDRVPSMERRSAGRSLEGDESLLTALQDVGRLLPPLWQGPP